MEGWFEKAGRLVLTDKLKVWTAWRLHWTGITGLKDHDWKAGSLFSKFYA